MSNFMETLLPDDLWKVDWELYLYAPRYFYMEYGSASFGPLSRVFGKFIGSCLL